MFEEEDKEFIYRFLAHTRKLQDNMIYFENRLDLYNFLGINNFVLVDRAMKHDLDKLESGLRDVYLKINEYHCSNKNNMSFEEVEDYIAQARDMHHSSQRHHFYCNDVRYNNIDICEMCCDIDAVFCLSRSSGEKNNKTYFVNYMLSHYPKLEPIKYICLKILDILEHKKDSIKNIKKANLIDNYINYVRNFQDNMLKLEINRNMLYFSIDKWEIIKTTLNYNKNDFSNIEKIGDNYFEFNKSKIIDDSNINKCCLVCSCYSFYKDKYSDYIDIDEETKNIISILSL